MEIEIGNTKVQRIKTYPDTGYFSFKTNVPQALVKLLELDDCKRIKWFINVQSKKVTLVFVDEDEHEQK